MQEETKLCLVKCVDGSVYTLRSGIKATLIEANARLVTEPHLLKDSRDYAGFLAVVIPSTVLNNHRNTIPLEFDTVVRIGTEASFVAKLLATNEQSNRHGADKDDLLVETPQEEDERPEQKRPKLDV